MEVDYRTFLEAAPDAMVISDLSGRIVLVNAETERVFGYSRDELVGQAVEILIPERFRARHPGHREHYGAHPRTRSMGEGLNLFGLRKDNSEFPVEISLSPIDTQQGKLVVSAIRDVTSRREIEASHRRALERKSEELKRSNEELQHFAYAAAHDLQEPLRMVASYTQLLSRRYRGKLDSTADEFIEFAVDGATRMQALISDLLSYSRVGTKQKELREASSEAALRDALTNLRGVITEGQAQVAYDALPVVLVDPAQLTLLFQNLIGNAIKYRDDKPPRVVVTATADDGEFWTFTVEDNGIGIEPQYFDKIFGVFQRLHKRADYPGTGIGLAICKKIVEQHGGKIWVESTPGQGSAFHFTLLGRNRRIGQRSEV